MTPDWRHWTVAGVLSLALHGALVMGAGPSPGVRLERSAGPPEIVWGMAAWEAPAAEPRPEALPEASPEPEPETEAERDSFPAPAPAPEAPAQALATEGAAAVPETETPDQEESARVAGETDPAPPLPRRRQSGAPPAPQADQPSRRQAKAAANGPAGRPSGSSGQRRESGGQADITSYSGRVLAHLQRHKRYPREAQARALRGTARLTFMLGAGGELRAARIASGSGHAVLDREVLAMVRRAAPFPAFPPGIGRTTMTFTVPVRFAP